MQLNTKTLSINRGRGGGFYKKIKRAKWIKKKVKIQIK